MTTTPAAQIAAPSKSHRSGRNPSTAIPHSNASAMKIDIHVWMVTSGFPALAAHVLVGKNDDCHARRRDLEEMLAREFGIEHTTLQVDHTGDHDAEGPRLKFQQHRASSS